MVRFVYLSRIFWTETMMKEKFMWMVNEILCALGGVVIQVFGLASRIESCIRCRKEGQKQ